ncbi:MAG: type II secretion system protein GspK [Desulfobacteraceae bacterium]|nr:type II secretion system protein GspK [Desulfobacteraceae bacterium]
MNSARILTIPRPFQRVPRRGKEAERGVALLVVIMVVLMVSFLASELIMQVRAELRIAANGKERAVSAFLAEAGVNACLFWLMGDKPLATETGKDEPFLAGHLYEAELPTGTVQYQAVGESGKIDLNTTPIELLKLFLKHEGLDEKQIDILTDSLQDWRDADDLVRMNGAESEYYQKLDDPYVARNGPIEDPSEIMLVRGADALRGRVVPEDVFTVHNPGGKIDFNSLTPAMLDFLVDGDQDREKAYREAQELYGTLNQANAMEILGDRFAIFANYLSFGSAQNSFLQGMRGESYYSIEATGFAGAKEEKGEEGEEARKRPGIRTRTLVKVTGNTVQYLSWKEESI